MFFDYDFLESTIERIYDCAVNPDNWQDTLTNIRDRFDLAYLSLHYMNFPPDYPRRRHEHFIVTTDWDPKWMEEVVKFTPEIPNFDQIVAKDIDQPTTQLRHVDEDEFVKSRFYKEWVAPQGLRDSCHVNVIQRGNMAAQLVGAVDESRALLSDAELEMLGLLTPHIRRALVISDMLNEKRARLQIYRTLLDHVSVAVYLVGPNARIVYANQAGEDMLSANSCLSGVGQRLSARSPIHAELFRRALETASSGQDATVGLWGNGMALPGVDGDTAIAYVLPMGNSEARHALGDGLAVVLVTTDTAARPPAVEVLTALSGMTVAEARVALGISEGRSIDEIASSQGIAVNTVRKHLSNAFDKTEARSQAALGAFVNRLRMPLRGGTELEGGGALPHG